MEREAHVEMQDMDQEDVLKAFFEKLDVIKNEINRIRQLLVKLQDANEESRTIEGLQAMKAWRDRMDRDLSDVRKTARWIKEELEQLDQANSASRRTRGCEEGSPVDRTRMSSANSLRTKMKGYMKEFEKLRARIMEEYREILERRCFTVTGQKPDRGSLEDIIETGDSEKLLQRAIQVQGRDRVQETIWEIQERHDGVKDIEKSLLELHQIFVDTIQEDQPKDMEANVNRSDSLVERLRVASMRRRLIRQRAFGLIVGGFFIVFFIIFLTIFMRRPP